MVEELDYQSAGMSDLRRTTRWSKFDFTKVRVRENTTGRGHGSLQGPVHDSSTT